MKDRLFLFFQKIKNFFTNLGEKAIFSIWITGVILAGALIWGLTGNLRNSTTADMIDTFFVETGERRRIGEAISPWGLPGKVTQLGTWFTLSDKEIALYFPIYKDGIFSPFLAIINDEGQLGAFIPLSKNGEVMLDRLSADYLLLCVEKIKSGALVLKENLSERGGQ
jgi:hypothetical protein